MVNRIKKSLGIIVIIACFIIFYSPTIFSFKLPIPADTIVGLYHPYRDLYASGYPNGIPFKNFLITDPVRQTYIWKELVIDVIAKGKIPSWNPYEMTGKPLTGNIQSAPFYPFNVIFIIKPFYLAWTIFIVLQTLLSLIFCYMYLRNLKIYVMPSVLGAVAFSFSGFSISWLEWGNILHTILWLPLILLTIDKVFQGKKSHFAWTLIFVFSVSSSLLAGHFQSFFYVILLALGYFILRFFEKGKKKAVLFRVVLLSFLASILTFPQWYPALKFLSLSYRSYDQNFQYIEGWFVPWQNLVQFISPDFFGNPSTLNYYGVWNYAEFVGYVGVITLAFAMTSFLKKNSTVIYFGIAIVVALLFSLPTGISSVPYILELPFLSSAQPTRLVSVIAFSLSVLAAFGMQHYLSKDFKISIRKLMPFLFVGLVLLGLWVATFTNAIFFNEFGQSEIARRNLILPTAIFGFGFIAILTLIKLKSLKARYIILGLIVLISTVDLLRFGNKFIPFTDRVYLYPITTTIDFLKSQEGVFRIASLDDRILPPNFSTHYKLHSIEGYDPLYLKNYAEFVAAMEQDKPNPSRPFGFNRIITPKNYNSQLFDFLNVKYVLSLDEISNPKLTKVFEEGRTKVYKNEDYMDRAFFVEEVNDSNKLDGLFEGKLKEAAYVNGYIQERELTIGEAQILAYSENEIAIKTRNDGEGFLVISDSYYPTWGAYVDGNKTEIYLTNHAFRGVVVPKGEHIVTMKNSLF